MPDEGGPANEPASGPMAPAAIGAAGPATPAIRGGDVPVLWKLARLAYDDVRARPILLYPEGIVMLNESGAAILRLCDGRRTVDDITAALSEQFATDIGTDVGDFLSGLLARELVRIAVASGARG